MTAPPAGCTCPTKFDDATREIVLAGRNQLCPVHGSKHREPPHCGTCTCYSGAPIVQTVDVARAQAHQTEGEEK